MPTRSHRGDGDLRLIKAEMGGRLLFYFPGLVNRSGTENKKLTLFIFDDSEW